MATLSTYPSPHSDPAPPTKANLKAWWKQFTLLQKLKGPPQPPNHATLVKEWGKKKSAAASPGKVFGVPLRESLRYASVHISTANVQGEMFVWGYIPVVVAKCGLYLKENATEIEGTFRINGSNRRMRDLQTLFETPPKYGKNVDWSKEAYTAHDVASVFRRYLTQMPEPVIPHDRYLSFRQVLARDPPLREDEAIEAYKKLILDLPRANQYLLLYVLDLLSVFMRKSDKNLMTATNLATIFRPGILSHPSHEMSPTEHRLSQAVLEFLIAQQDWFMLDVPPPPRRDSIMAGAVPIDPTYSPPPVMGKPLMQEPMAMRPHEREYTQSGWKLVEDDPAKGIDRRHTMVERGSIRNPSVKVLGHEKQPIGSLFPASEIGELEQDVVLGDGTAKVKRSATIPSRSSHVINPLGASSNTSHEHIHSHPPSSPPYHEKHLR